MSESHIPQTADQKRYGYLYRMIADKPVVTKFWLNQPLFLHWIRRAEMEGIEIDRKTILCAMEKTYEAMDQNKELAKKSDFWFGTARNSINRVRRTLQ